MKKCKKCGIKKDNNNFNKSSHSTDGLHYWCKNCRREYRITNYARFSVTNKEYKKEYNSKNKDKNNTNSKKYYNLNIEKQKAKAAVSRAIKKGIMIKECCEICGNIKSEAHHYSYLKHHWLDVVWLCRCHHQREHARLNGINQVVDYLNEVFL